MIILIMPAKFENGPLWPQAYFLACDELPDKSSVPSPVKGCVDPYVEVKATGSATVVRRRRVTNQRPASGTKSIESPILVETGY